MLSDHPLKSPRIMGAGSVLAFSLSLLLLPGCAVKQQWVHPDKNQEAFYRDDAKCLEFSNKVLFEQLQEISPQQSSADGPPRPDEKSFCILPGAGKRIHLRCMEERGWAFR